MDGALVVLSGILILLRSVSWRKQGWNLTSTCRFGVHDAKLNDRWGGPGDVYFRRLSAFTIGNLFMDGFRSRIGVLETIKVGGFGTVRIPTEGWFFLELMMMSACWIDNANFLGTVWKVLLEKQCGGHRLCHSFEPWKRGLCHHEKNGHTNIAVRTDLGLSCDSWC